MNVHLDAIGIITHSIAESVRFYRALGLAIPGEPDGPHFEATLPNGMRLMWDSVELMREMDPEAPEPVGQRMGLAFHCGDAASVDETYARLQENGFEGHLAPWDAFWGQRYATVFDPDGNEVSLFAPLPVSEE